MGQGGLAVVPPASPAALSLDPHAPAHFIALTLLGAPPVGIQPRPTGAKPGFTTADKTQGVSLAVATLMDLLYVESLGCCYKPLSPSLYERCDDYRIKQEVKTLWNRNIQFLGSLDTKKLRECVEMAKESAPHYEEDLNRRYIGVAPNLFWDSETASLTEAPETPVFFRLFDNPAPNQHSPRVTPFTAEQIATLQASYKASLEHLEAHHGDLPEEYEFVTLWANYNHDVYMDIMRLMASPFMRKKPFGAYMLVGLKRNGKTALSNDFMKTLLGPANCTGIQLAQLGNPHQNNALQWTLWNAPDEEDEKPTQYATIFKTMADHGEIKVDKMFSAEGVKIDCDFMCAFPMNHHPTWTGSGAAACVERSRIIEFTHRFQQDDNPVSFAERTFTADLFCRILGPILALATYHLDKPMIWSPVMRMQQEALEGEMDSHTTYYDHFIAFFDGFQSINLLYDDYQLWCKAHDVPVSTLAAFKLAFGAFTSTGRKTIKVNGRATKGFRVRQQGKRPLFPDMTYEVLHRKLGPVSVYHDPREPLRYSIVERCEAILEEKLGDRAEEELKKLIQTATTAMGDRPRPEIPPAPEQETLDGGLFDEEV